MKIRGSRLPSARSCRCSSRPDMPVSWMSTSRQPKEGRAGSARKLSADSNPFGSNPAPRNRRPSARLALASSSIIATLFVPMTVAGHASSAPKARLLPLGAGLSWLWEESDLARKRGELGDRAHPELGGDRVAMQLDGALVDAERRGDLLVHPALHHLLEHLALAHGEGGKALLELSALQARHPRVGIALESLFEGAEECLLRSALVEEIDRAVAHRGHRAWHIAVPGEKHEGQRDAQLCARLLQLQTIEPRHAQVREHTARFFRRGVSGEVREQFRAGAVALHTQSRGGQHARHGPAERGVVIDDVYDPRSAHDTAPCACARVNRNVSPLPSGARSAHSRPPCASMMVREIGNPMPRPPDLVV